MSEVSEFFQAISERRDRVLDEAQYSERLMADYEDLSVNADERRRRREEANLNLQNKLSLLRSVHSLRQEQRSAAPALHHPAAPTKGFLPRLGLYRCLCRCTCILLRCTGTNGTPVFFLLIFAEVLSGFRDKFQKRVTCVASSIEFAKTN